MNAVAEPVHDRAAHRPKRAAASSTRCHHILVVDDVPAIRMLNSLVLFRAGYHVEQAEDGLAAWQAAQRHHFDLILTDNQMPGMSGLEFVKQLRASGMTMPVVLASGTLDGEELRRHQPLGLAATMPKPYTIEELLATVERVLGVPPRPPTPAITTRAASEPMWQPARRSGLDEAKKSRAAEGTTALEESWH